eukprot:TRINITY_DN5223_c0_g1_i1.p1 TRINITY_DN5223_c0_g1~~TRINITY_DN5223_c0_g1_i1.p1  ORF type:complete len:593 (+),score=131.02 TRINITY_DN5223_c0_g1_i1:161-1939(+)
MNQSVPPSLEKRAERWDMKDLADWYRTARDLYIKKMLMKKAGGYDAEEEEDEGDEEEEDEEEYRHLVVIIADFDFFPTNVIQDLVSICSTHQSSLRMTFVFGIATTAAIGEVLPRWTTSLLKIERFSLQVTMELLADVVDTLFIRGGAQRPPTQQPDVDVQETLGQPFPVRLGYDALTFIIDNFRQNDFSCKTLSRILYFITFQHHYNNPLVIINTTSETNLKASALHPDHLKWAERLPSLRAKINEMKRKVPNLSIGTLLERYNIISDFYHTQYPAAFGCYCALQAYLTNIRGGNTNTPIKTLSKTRRLFEYQKLLSPDALKRFQEVKEELLKPHVSSSAIAEQLKRWLTILGCGAFVGAVDCIKYLLELASAIADNKPQPKMPKNDYISQPSEEEESQRNTPSEPKTTTMAPSKRMQRKMALQQACVQSGGAEDDVSKQRMIEFIDQFFRLHLVPYHQLTMQENFYYNDARELAATFNASMRESLNRALTNPHSYLNCDCCSLDQTELIPNTMPDICILYKLIEKSNKMINLYDLYCTFKGLYSKESYDKEKILQARFFQAIKEMRFLGLIKETNRKQDHVIKIVHTLAI